MKDAKGGMTQMNQGLSPDSLLKEAEKILLAMVHDSGHAGITLDELVRKTGSTHQAISNILKKLGKQNYISMREQRFYSNLEVA
jgi:DNA-binding MarR family transcriptional regulator